LVAVMISGIAMHGVNAVFCVLYRIVSYDSLETEMCDARK